MNKEFDYYINKIIDISPNMKIFKTEFNEFYEKYKNTYEFDDMLNEYHEPEYLRR